jgi:serine/threonine-protein kinase
VATAHGPLFEAGKLIPGTKYRVVKWLGAGAMGVVYQVEKAPNIRGVLKLMSTSLTKHESLKLRFFDEVRVIAELEHPNIVRVFDYDTLEDGTPFYVMEHLTGQTVGEVLSTVDRFPPTVAYEVTRQLLEALHCAHTNPIQVIHRDIKPDNIFLHVPKHGEPVVKLIDFGVSTVSDRGQVLGVFAGTPSYASPEQIAGEACTPASDLYSVAIVLYEMLTGVAPFSRHPTPEAVMKAQREEIPVPVSNWVRGIPPSIVKLIEEALSKDPAKRPHDAYSFSERLYELQWASVGVDPRAETYEGLGDPPHAKPPAEGTLSGVLSTYAAVRAAHVTTNPLAGGPPANPPARAETPEPPPASARDTFSSQESDARRLPAKKRVGFAAMLAAVLLFAVIGVVLLTRRGTPPAAPATTVAKSVTASPPPEPVLPITTVTASVTADAPIAPPAPEVRTTVRTQPSGSPSAAPARRTDPKRTDYMNF